MNIKYTPTNPAPVAEETVIIGGIEVGTVKPYHNQYATTEDKFQASLSLAKGPLWSSFYAGGFGPTKEAAITQALDNGEAQANQVLAEIAQLRGGE